MSTVKLRHGHRLRNLTLKRHLCVSVCIPKGNGWMRKKRITKILVQKNKKRKVQKAFEEQWTLWKRYSSFEFHYILQFVFCLFAEKGAISSLLFKSNGNNGGRSPHSLPSNCLKSEVKAALLYDDTMFHFPFCSCSIYVSLCTLPEFFKIG